MDRTIAELMATAGKETNDVELLTHDEYKAIAEGLTLASTSFVDGGFRKAASGATIDSVNPATGAVLAKVAACDADDVDFAVSKAREAFDDGRWRCLHPAERKEVLIRLAKLIRRNRHGLAVLESLDSGKPVRDCATIDIPETITTLIWHAEAVDKLYDQTAPVGEDAVAMVVRADWCCWCCAAMEFPAADAGLEDWSGARGELLDGGQACRADFALGAAGGRTGHGGRRAAWCSQHHHRHWP